ncbi:hypothetical protein YC2023_019407 [Brassica napus]
MWFINELRCEQCFYIRSKLVVELVNSVAINHPDWLMFFICRKRKYNYKMNNMKYNNLAHDITNDIYHVQPFTHVENQKYRTYINSYKIDLEQSQSLSVRDVSSQPTQPTKSSLTHTARSIQSTCSGISEHLMKVFWDFVHTIGKVLIKG